MEKLLIIESFNTTIPLVLHRAKLAPTNSINENLKITLFEFFLLPSSWALNKVIFFPASLSFLFYIYFVFFSLLLISIFNIRLQSATAVIIDFWHVFATNHFVIFYNELIKSIDATECLSVPSENRKSAHAMNYFLFSKNLRRFFTAEPGSWRFKVLILLQSFCVIFHAETLFREIWRIYGKRVINLTAWNRGVFRTETNV